MCYVLGFSQWFTQGVVSPALATLLRESLQCILEWGGWQKEFRLSGLCPHIDGAGGLNGLFSFLAHPFRFKYLIPTYTKNHLHRIKHDPKIPPAKIKRNFI